MPQNALLAAGSILNRVELQDIDTLQTGITKRSAVGTTALVTELDCDPSTPNSNSPLLESPHDNSLAVDFTLTQRLLGRRQHALQPDSRPTGSVVRRDTNLNNYQAA